MSYRLSVILILIAAGISEIHGQQFSEMRSWSNSFAVGKESSLELNNKYGSIHITTWNKDSVAIRAEAEAFASSSARLGKMLEGVSVSITGSGNQIKARTEFTESLNMLFESFKGMTNKLIPYESRISINYYVSMPEFMDLRIENKYGDVFMENNSGTTNLNLSNGTFRANNLKKSGSLNLTFCDATINKLSDAVLSTSFSEISIGESGSLIVTSVSSRFDLRTVESLNAESRRDKFFIGTLGSLRGNSYFTDYRIDRLNSEADMTSKYGSVSIDEIKKSFQAIDITSGYSDLNLTFEPLSSFNLDIRHQNTFLTVPSENSSITKKPVNEERKEYISTGTIGRNPGKTTVRINATRGNIFIR
jgi:hypothetical protein